ncbi:TPA: riboflavin synthase, partial [Campylobacter jejuni]|nr:riboflavin synthase [Campylobacter jejuni]
MFNGLIREIAKVQSYQNNTLSLTAKHRPNLGDSIAVNGACLSVTKL